MPAGFQSIGTSGSYQIDSNFTNLALDRSGQLSSQQYMAGDTFNTRPTRVAVTLTEGEILAFSCTAAAAVGTRTGNLSYIFVDAPAGTIVKYYIFKPGYTSSTFGLQVYNEAGGLTFDSSWRLFDVRSLVNGYNTWTLAGGREYAVVHTKIATSVRYTRVVNGQPPNQLGSWVRVTAFSCASVVGNSITTRLANVDSWATAPQPGGGSSSYSETYSNGVTPSFIVIDVTGY